MLEEAVGRGYHVSFSGLVTFRRFTDTPPGYDTAPRRVRVCVDLILGDLNLSRAG